MAGTLVAEVVGPGATVVGIHEHVRPPGSHEVGDVVGQSRLFDLHIVTVEVDAPGVPPRAPLRGLVSIGIDLGGHQDRHLVQEVVGGRSRGGEIPHEDQEPFPEGPLPAMDVRRQKHDGPAQGPRLPRARSPEAC